MKKYQQIYRKRIRQYDLVEKCRQLDQEFRQATTITREMLEEAERLDGLRTAFMLEAEKKCRRFNRDGFEWSPTIQQELDHD